MQKYYTLQSLLQETNELLADGSVKKAYRFCNKPFQEPRYYFRDNAQTTLHIQLARRMAYICVTILENYLRRYSEKSHKVKPLLMRGFDACDSWKFFILNALNCNEQSGSFKQSSNFKRRSTKRISFFLQHQSSFLRMGNTYADLDSPLLNKEDENQTPIKTKSDKWYEFQKQQLFFSYETLLKQLYLYLKLRKDTAHAPLVYIRLHKCVQFSENVIKFNQSYLQTNCSILLLLGNAYFELEAMPQAMQYYQKCLELSLMQGIFSLLDQREKERLKISDRYFWKNISLNIFLAVLALDALSHSYEYMSNYSQAVQTLSFSEFLCGYLYFLRNGTELCSYILARHEFVYGRYVDHLNEQQELTMLTKKIFNINPNIIQADTNTYHKKKPSEQLQEDMFNKFHYDNMYIIEKKPWEQEEPIPAQKIKKMMQIENSLTRPVSPDAYTNTTFHSKNHSLDWCQVDITPSPGLASISLNQKRLFSPINSQNRIKQFKFKRNQKNKIVKRDKGNYLTQLIAMHSEKIMKFQNHTETEDEFFKEKKEQKLKMRTLDQEMDSVIMEKMTSKARLDSWFEVQNKCGKLIKSEKDFRKEMPLTMSMLTFRKEFGNGQGILPESVEEFHRHFEFNVMKYFDYLTSNNESAMKKVQDSENFKSMRLAEQKLLSSGKLVIKEVVEINNTEIEEELQEEQNIENQANQLLSDTSKKRQKKNNEIGFYRRNDKLTDIYDEQKEKMKNAHMQQIIMTSDDQTQLKLNIALVAKNLNQENKQQQQYSKREHNEIYEEIRQQRNEQIAKLQKSQAQDDIKKLLSINELQKEQYVSQSDVMISIQYFYQHHSKQQFTIEPPFIPSGMHHLANSTKHCSKKSRTYFNIVKHKLFKKA